jgi:hypothetical protein
VRRNIPIEEVYLIMSKNIITKNTKRENIKRLKLKANSLNAHMIFVIRDMPIMILETLIFKSSTTVAQQNRENRLQINLLEHTCIQVEDRIP